MISNPLPKYLILEPTLGIPLQPLLVDELCRTNDYERIIWLQPINFKDNSSSLFSKIIDRPIVTLQELIPVDKIGKLEENANLVTNRLLEGVSDECHGLHQILFEDIPIGLYLVSHLQRHYIELCVEWRLPKHFLKNLLLEWIRYSLYLKLLIKQCSTNSAAIFTHHVYFFGYLSEFLYRHGIKSLTNGSPSIPLLKPSITEYNSYDWSMGTNRQHQITIPTSCYEYSQRGNKFSKDYLHFIQASVSKKVSAKSFTSMLQKNNYKRINSLLDNKNIQVWQHEQSYPSWQKNDSDLHFCFHLHSFSDSTFTYEYDGFDTLIDYFYSTSAELVKSFPNATFYIRPHPNIFSKYFTDRVERDVKLTIHLVRKMLSNISNLVFVMPTISNSCFFNISEKSTIITHHSPSMALEATLANRFLITSASSIKLKINSPLIHKIRCKKSLSEDVINFKDRLVNKQSISSRDIEYLISEAVPKLFYNPIYKNAINRQLHLPSLLAGYGDYHKEFAPEISSMVLKNSSPNLNQIRNILENKMPGIACKYFFSEISYMADLLNQP